MSYVTSPYAAKARFEAVKLVLKGELKAAHVARMYGVQRSTISKWVKRFPQLGSIRVPQFISTQSSAPKNHPNQLKPEVVQRIINLRLKYKRCAQVIHAYLIKEGISVSLSSVKRTLKRQGLTRRKKQARYYVPLPRPTIEMPGSLVQLDTIHFVKTDHSRFYIYALIDTYTRLAYAEYHPKLSQQLSFEVIKNAQKSFGFKFQMVQTDNGPEFKDWFLIELTRSKIALRHSRVRKPNDNAHIERFNRTIQEECFGNALPNEETIQKQIKKYLVYYNKKRLHLSLNLQTPTQFVSKVLN
jgi:transposase InsO family protein